MKKIFKDIREVYISVDTIDNLVDSGKIEKPDFVKIDVEGAEMEVLEGMIGTVRNFKPELFIEVHGADLKQARSNAKNLIYYLVKNKYSIYHIELGKVVNSSNYSIATSGHIYCF